MSALRDPAAVAGAWALQATAFFVVRTRGSPRSPSGNLPADSRAWCRPLRGALAGGAVNAPLECRCSRRTTRRRTSAALQFLRRRSRGWNGNMAAGSRPCSWLRRGAPHQAHAGTSRAAVATAAPAPRAGPRPHLPARSWWSRPRCSRHLRPARTARPDAPTGAVGDFGHRGGPRCTRGNFLHGGPAMRTAGRRPGRWLTGPV
ncbi:hypothetical protein QJS66_13185 [Kocuria rhizophila]|nr:hypothetical protein QJS66_13185 [Kocuria rhizophila]